MEKKIQKKGMTLKPSLTDIGMDLGIEEDTKHQSTMFHNTRKRNEREKAALEEMKDVQNKRLATQRKQRKVLEDGSKKLLEDIEKKKVLAEAETVRLKTLEEANKVIDSWHYLL